MLDFLDHENPLIRYCCKNWLNQTTGLLHRILDPLIEVLLQSSDLWYETPTHQYFYSRIYETRRTIEILKKLKSIFLNIPKQFIEYIANSQISEWLSYLATKFTN